jgi:hypothetical protein
MSGAVFPGAATADGHRTKVWARLTVTLALLIPFAGAAHADETVAWTFEVLEVSRIDRDRHLIRLRPRPSGRKFPRSCETFVVHALFDLEIWSATSRRMVTRVGHERSLRLLEQARITNEIVRFGALGHGFGAIAESPKCEVASRALQMIVEDDGTSAVYSVFEEPSQ